MQTYAEKKQNLIPMNSSNSAFSSESSIPNSFYSVNPSAANSGLETALKSRMNMSSFMHSPAASNALSSLHSHERQMSDDLGNKLKDRFGTDMRGMRIFEDDGLQERFGQRAYAKGNEIHLAHGEFSPDTPSGLDLIMHEASHVIQQGSGMVHSHGITENPALEAQAHSGLTAPDSFTMPVASDSSAIQGWAPWQKLKGLFTGKNNDTSNAAQPQAEAAPPQEENRSLAERAWDATKQGAGKAWDATKRGAGKAWDATKRGAGKAWDATKRGAGKAWDTTKWGAKAVWNGVKKIGKKALDSVGLIDAHRQAVDQFNNYREDYDKMSTWERFKWTAKNPFARMFAGLEKGNTARRNREEELLGNGEGADTGTYSIDSEDAKQFDPTSAFSDTSKANGVHNYKTDTKLLNAGGKLGTVGTLSSLAAIPVGLGGKTGMNMKEKGVTLGTSDHAVGGVASGLNAVGALANFTNSTAQTFQQADNGNKADTIRNALDMVNHGANFIGQTTRLASYAAGANNLIQTMDTQVIPGLDVASGALTATKGLIGYGSGRSTEKAMDKRLNAKDADKNSDIYKASKMARNKAHINKVQGGFDMASGALKAAGGGLKLAGVSSLVGTAVGAVGSGVGFVGGCVTDQMKKDMRFDLVNDELGLEDKITEFCARNNCDRKTAKHVILRKMGYQSGKRKEVFNNIVLNRAAKMKKKADSGDEEAMKFMADLGLKSKKSKDKSGGTKKVYSLQGVAEKLGMEGNATWEEQLRNSQNRRKYDRSNPFAKTAT